MNEFQKPYEYTEDKKGAILYFVIMLISLDVLFGVTYTVQVGRAFREAPFLYYCSFAIHILYLLFILYTAITCFRLKKNLVITSKIFIIFKTVYSTVCAIIVFFNAIQVEGGIGGSMSEDKISILALQILIVPLTCVYFTSIVWFLYFSKSKRCKEIAKG
jgi:hypothetical protein